MPIRWQKLQAMPDVPADSGRDLFDSDAWAAAVACLGGHCWRGLDQAKNRGITMFVWKKGPIKVGYLGFPVSPPWLLEDAAWRENSSPVFPERIDFVRTNFSALDADAPLGMPHTLLPESVIPDLSAWPIRNLRKVRKDLALGNRHGVVLANAALKDADGIYSMYQQTISRRRGRLRYTLEYFRELIGIAGRRQDLQVRVACHQKEVIGFCVAVRNANRGYYLHAAVAEGSRHLGAADMLADDAIRWAASAGCKSFSLMASPAGQGGLHKFKQKWAELDGQWITVDTPRGLLGRLTALLLKAGG